MKTYVTILLCLVATLGFSIDTYKMGDVLFVHAPSGLKLRPAANSDDALATLPYGAKVTVLENLATTYPKEVDGFKGYWARVEFEGKRGFVFDGYLSFLPTPKAGCTSLKQYCADYFVSGSKELVQSLSCDDEVTDETTVKLYSYKGRQVVLSINVGYEWGGETMTIENLSLAEGYLLAKGLYKKDFVQTYNHFKSQPDAAQTIDNVPVDIDSYITFKPAKDSPKCISLEFLSDCSEQLNVVQRKGVLLIRRSGGC